MEHFDKLVATCYQGIQATLGTYSEEYFIAGAVIAFALYAYAWKKNFFLK